MRLLAASQLLIFWSRNASAASLASDAHHNGSQTGSVGTRYSTARDPTAGSHSPTRSSVHSSSERAEMTHGMTHHTGRETEFLNPIHGIPVEAASGSSNQEIPATPKRATIDIGHSVASGDSYCKESV